MASQTMVENYCLSSHTSSSRKYKGVKEAVTILTRFFRDSVSSIQRENTGVAVAWYIRKEHPYVKKTLCRCPTESSLYLGEGEGPIQLRPEQKTGLGTDAQINNHDRTLTCQYNAYIVVHYELH